MAKTSSCWLCQQVFLCVVSYMDYEIKPFGKESSISGSKFEDGDTVHCFLVRKEDGEIFREDLHESEIGKLDASWRVLGRWSRIFESKPDTREETQNHQKSLEELFLSLFEAEDGSASEESDALKQIVALMLERKRILRRQDEAEGPGVISYLHVSSKNKYNVPSSEVTPEVVMKIHQQLSVLVG